MGTETEIKVRLSDAERIELINRVRAAGAALEVDDTQRDEYFDSGDGGLQKADLTLRLRIIGGRVWVAMKGPRMFGSDNVHSRIELEFEAANGPEVRSQLDRQGLTATAIVEKWRLQYRLGQCAIAIDTVPFIGSFAEVEGISREGVWDVVALFRLDPLNSVKENYSELAEAELRRLGLPIRPNLRVTFEAMSAYVKTASK
jgi:predicted adenylyl cyclase CyaB